VGWERFGPGEKGGGGERERRENDKNIRLARQLPFPCAAGSVVAGGRGRHAHGTAAGEGRIVQAESRLGGLGRALGPGFGRLEAL